MVTSMLCKSLQKKAQIFLLKNKITLCVMQMKRKTTMDKSVKYDPWKDQTAKVAQERTKPLGRIHSPRTRDSAAHRTCTPTQFVTLTQTCGSAVIVPRTSETPSWHARVRGVAAREAAARAPRAERWVAVAASGSLSRRRWISCRRWGPDDVSPPGTVWRSLCSPPTDLLFCSILWPLFVTSYISPSCTQYERQELVIYLFILLRTFYF